MYLFIFGSFGFLLLHGFFFFFNCGEGRLLSRCGMQASHCSGFSCFRSRALGFVGFGSCGSWAVEQRLNSCDTWAWLPRGMWDFSGSNRTHVSCLSRWTLYHWTTKGAQDEALSWRKHMTIYCLYSNFVPTCIWRGSGTLIVELDIKLYEPRIWPLPKV